MGPGSDEKFCLRWNDFQESILSTLQDLRAEEDFVDVTLVCEGGHQVAAHKLILSACSDFFRHLLRRTPAPNPVIVLWDVGVDDLRKILKFMYNGEVEVRQAHLNSFLAVAERLRVRGLCQSGGKGSPNPDRRASSPRPGGSGSRSTSPSSRRKRSPDEPDRKRPRTEEDDNEEEGDHEDGGGMTIKEESAGGSGNNKDVENRSDGGGDYGEFPAGPGSSGGGAFDEHSAGALPALMGMAGMPPGGILDPVAAKEFWRRAAMARMSLGGSSSSGGSPPGFPGGHGLGSSTPSPSGPSEPTRRQRSVYSSSQIAQLEAYFGCNEYIDGDRKRQLSILTKIPEQQIKVWFQNRRQKKKRELEEQQQMGHPSGGGGRHHQHNRGGGGEQDFKIQLGPRRNEDHHHHEERHSEGALPLLPPPPEDEEYSDDEGDKPLQIDQNR